MGGTTAWKLCTLSAGSTLAVVYDIVAQHGGGGGDPMAAAGGQQFFLQFVTRYLHDSGAMRCRVTTITRRRVARAAPRGGGKRRGGVRRQA